MVRTNGLGSLLKLARKRKGLTQQEVGEGVGKSQNTICAYERGQVPSLDALERLIALFDVDDADALRLRAARERLRTDSGTKGRGCRLSDSPVVPSFRLLILTDAPYFNECLFGLIAAALEPLGLAATATDLAFPIEGKVWTAATDAPGDRHVIVYFSNPLASDEEREATEEYLSSLSEEMQKRVVPILSMTELNSERTRRLLPKHPGHSYV